MDKNIEICKLLDTLLSKGRECEWIEFKKDKYAPDDMGKCLSALSNSSLLCKEPYGYIIFGIEDESLAVIGSKFSFYKTKVGNEELENWLASQLDPKVDIKGFEFLYHDKQIVMIRIEATSDTPVSFKGMEYVRIGSYNKKLREHPEKARKIWINKGENSFDKKIAIDDIKFNEIFKLIDYPKFFELMNLPLPREENSLMNKLEEEKIIKKPSYGNLAITNLGAILFARDMNNFDRIKRKVVRVIFYKNDNKVETKKRANWSERLCFRISRPCEIYLQSVANQ